MFGLGIQEIVILVIAGAVFVAVALAVVSFFARRGGGRADERDRRDREDDRA